MIIVFFNSSLLLVFLVAVFALGIQALSALNGFIAGLAIVIFIIEVLILAGINVLNVFQPKNRSITGVFKLIFALISSSICAYTSYLFLFDLQNYTDSISDLLEFVIVLIFCGGAWLFQVGGAIATNAMIYMSGSEICAEDSGIFGGIIMQVISAVFLFWLYGT